MTNDLPKVRKANPADEEEIMALCRALHEENGLFSLSERKVRHLLHRSFANDKTFVVVIGQTGKIEATSCIFYDDCQYYSDDLALIELWNHVDVPYRNSRNIDALIEFSKSCSMNSGLPLVIGIITNNRVESKVRKYRQLLGPPAGAFFVFNAKWANGVEPSRTAFERPFESRAERRQRERREQKENVR